MSNVKDVVVSLTDGAGLTMHADRSPHFFPRSRRTSWLVAGVVFVASVLPLVRSTDAVATTPVVRGYSWGLGTIGQLGNSAASTFNYPVQVTSSGALFGKTLTSVAAGSNFACGLVHDGVVANTRVYCWGEGSLGQLGNAASSDFTFPVAVAGALASVQVSDISAGLDHACAVTVAGAVYCWGNNTSGQLGQGTSTGSSNIPLLVSGGSLSGTTMRVSAGSSFSCAITPASATKTQCWGINTTGQIGDGTITTPQTLPVAVTGTVTSSTPSTISSGASHTCVVSTVGSVQCWGLGTSGQLGNNAVLTSTTSVTVIGLPTTTNKIATGGAFSCASTSAGTGYCWGLGTSGQLGNTLVVNASSAVAVYTGGALSGKSISKIRAGSINTCAVTTDGGAYCWGAGTNGALGNNTVVQANEPVAVDTSRTATGAGVFTDIALGTSFATSVFEPASAPDPPTSVSADAGNASATVTFAAPANTGGSAITGYTVTSSGGQTCSPVLPTLSCTVTGLANGTSYSFTVTATNVAGTGSASTASSPVTPRATPDPPTGVTAVAGLDGMTPLGSQTAKVTWVPPVNSHGSAVTSYTVTSTPAGGTGCTTVAAPTVICIVGTLTDGIAYTFTVTATNAAGASIASNPTAPVTPATVPSPPTTISVVAGANSIIVSWVAPITNGGAAITSYTATTTPSGATCTAVISPCTITGLANGTTYTEVHVVATNSVGNSVRSAPSGSVTPTAVTTVSLATISISGVMAKHKNKHVAKLYGYTARPRSRVTIYRVFDLTGKTKRIARRTSNFAGRWEINLKVGNANSAKFFAVVGRTRSTTIVITRT